MRVLFTSTPLYGHFLPMLPLVDAAVEAGHDVVVATGPDLADEVTRRDLPLWQVGRARLRRSRAWRHCTSRWTPPTWSCCNETPSRSSGGPASNGLEPSLPWSRAGCPTWWSTSLRTTRATRWPQPCGVLGVAHGFGPHMPHTVDVVEFLCAAGADVLGSPNRSDVVLGSVYVDPWPVALRSREPSPWADVLPVRPEPERSDSSDSLPGEVTALAGEPMVYVTLGTVFGSAEALAMVLEAVSGLPCTVVATTGPTVAPEALGPLLANALVVPFLPQNRLLALSAAVISHAGSGTVLGALAAHLPHVCLPLAADQFVNAKQIAMQGAGIAIPAEARSVASIRAAVERVLDDQSYAAQAAALYAQIEQMPPAAVVLDELERRVAARRA